LRKLEAGISEVVNIRLASSSLIPFAGWDEEMMKS